MFQLNLIFRSMFCFNFIFNKIRILMFGRNNRLSKSIKCIHSRKVVTVKTIIKQKYVKVGSVLRNVVLVSFRSLVE